MKRNIIVIGASMGGFEALQRLITDLPADLDAAIFIVWHLAADSANVLPQVLGRRNRIAATTAVDGERVEFNHIYTAPPDRHLVLERGVIRVTRGPKENRFRPAVDPLFRSAALAYGPRVIGVILSGALDDGASGLWSIKQHGGLAVVQDPLEAEVPSMPRTALRIVRADHVLQVAEMGALLGRLVKEEAPPMKEKAMPDDKRSKSEVRIAIQDDLETHVEGLGEWTPLTCPECHGALTALKEGDRIRYRCHTGHAFSADSLLDALSASIEDSLWSAIRAIKENVLLLNQMGDYFSDHNNPRLAALFFKKAIDAEARMESVWQAVKQTEHINVERLEQEDEDGAPSSEHVLPDAR